MMVKRSPTSPTMTTSIAKTLLNQRNEILQVPAREEDYNGAMEFQVGMRSPKPH